MITTPISAVCDRKSQAPCNTSAAKLPKAGRDQVGRRWRNTDRASYKWRVEQSGSPTQSENPQHRELEEHVKLRPESKMPGKHCYAALETCEHHSARLRCLSRDSTFAT
eukprot:2328418-Rhodomonas_salina.2